MMIFLSFVKGLFPSAITAWGAAFDFFAAGGKR